MYGILSARGGYRNSERQQKRGLGGGGRIAIHSSGQFLTSNTYEYDVSGYRTGTYAVYGESRGEGLHSLVLESGKLTFTTDNAGWYHNSGVHGVGEIRAYDAPELTFDVAEYKFSQVNLGSSLAVVFDGANPLRLTAKDPSGTAGKFFPVDSNALGNRFFMAGDYTSYFPTGVQIKLRGNVFTIANSKFAGGNTEITLNVDHGATVGDKFSVVSSDGNMTIGTNLDLSGPAFEGGGSNNGVTGARGFLGGGYAGNSGPAYMDGTGLGGGQGRNNGSSGGGHASEGQQGVEASLPGATYGTPGIAYLLPGSGGGGGYHGTGGAGGGAIALEADRELVIGSGVTISADGASVTDTTVYTSVGAGSGGAIRLRGYNITNNGTLSAKGGFRGSGSRGGNGGDGRVAFNYSKTLIKGTVDVGIGGTQALSTSPSVTGDFDANGDLVATASWQEYVPPTAFQEMILWWSFEEGSGATAIDYTGHNLHGTLENGAGYQDGLFGKALYFDGSDDRVRLNYDPKLAVEQYTVSIWMKSQQDNDDYAGVFGRSGRVYAFWTNNTNNAAGWYVHHRYWDATNTNAGVPNAGMAGTNARIPHDVWHHIVLVNNGATSATWVDGEESATGTVTGGLFNRSSTLWLAGNPDNGANNWKGWIEDVRLYKKALTNQQIETIYGAGNGDEPKGVDVDIFTIAGTQNPTSFSASGLPIGIIVNPETGLIRGTPSTVGTFDINLTATNLAGTSEGQILKLTINPVPPTITNTAATNIGSTSAVANVSITQAGGANPVVTLYYGRTDGGTTAGSWDNNIDFGAQPQGDLQIGMSGLDLGADYYYRAYADHGVAGVSGTWADASIAFTTSSVAGPPLVAAKSSANYTGSSADVSGQLLSFDGADQPTITILYGKTDQGAVDTGWDGTASLGQKPTGIFTGNITGLDSASLYYFRFKAANNGGTHISDAKTFATIGAPLGETKPPSDVAPTSATLRMKVTGTGGFRQELPGTDPLVNDQLIAHWRFDEGEGNVMTDSNAGYIGTFVGGAGPNWVSGKFGQAMLFDTGDNAVLLDSATIPDPTIYDGVSVTLWLYGADNFKANTIGFQAYGPAGEIMKAHLPWGNGAVYWDEGGDRVNNSGDVSPGMIGSSAGWCHLAFTKDRASGSMKIFHNGAVIASGTGKTLDRGLPDTRFYLGTDVNRNSDMRGTIDDFRVYGKGLTDAEVTTMYGGGNGDLSGGIIVVETGGDKPSVKFYWGDNDGGDSTDVDPADDTKWDNVVEIAGTHALNSIVTSPLTGLTKGTTYYYRAEVTNSSGSAWAGSTRTVVPTNTLLSKDTIPGLVLWLDAAETNGDGFPDTLADGDKLATWADRSGNNVLVEQSTASAQPVYKKAQAGTKPILRFDGAGDFMYVVGALAADGSDSSIYVAHQRLEQSGNAGGIVVDEASGEIPSTGAGPYSMKVSKLNQTAATLKNIKIGKDALATDKNFGGDIAEILVFNRKLNYQEDNQVTGYLAHKWGGTDSLPNSHPYMDQAPVFDNSPKIVLAKGVEGFDLPARQGLLGEWLFDDDTANDTSGNNFHGTNSGGVFTTDTPTGSGKAIDFSTGDNYINVDDGLGQTVFDTGAALSTSFWAKKWPDGGWEPYICKGGESGRGWQIRRYSGEADTLVATYRGAGDDNPRAVTPVNDGYWHHIATILGGGRAKIFVDGVKLLDYAQGGTITTCGSQLTFGARDGSQDATNAIAMQRFARVLMDDIRIYNRAITDDEAVVLSGFFVNRIEGNYGNAFSYQIQTTKGPDTFTVVAGALPNGLTLSNSGLVSGTPTQTGLFEATIKIANSAGDDTKKFFFRIREGIQSLTFDQEFGAKVYGDGDFALTASSNAVGSDIVFYSKNENVIQITGNGSITPTAWISTRVAAIPPPIA